MNRTAKIIADTVIACMKASGVSVCRDGDLVDCDAFARDIGANAAMCLEGDYEGALVARTVKAYREQDALDEVFAEARQAVSKLEQERDAEAA